MMAELYQQQRGLALARAAEAMLRTLGGGEVCIRFPAMANSALAEFGIAQVATSDLPIGPVVVRSGAGSQDRFEVLVSAATVERHLVANGIGSVDGLFTSCLGIVHGGRLLRIVRVSTEWFCATPYLYRIFCE